MKNIIFAIVKDYLELFPFEKERQTELLEFLNKHNDEEITDWNNFNGHVVAGGFIYAKEEEKFLVLFHKDLKMFLYPGGHMNRDDKDPLNAARREIKEETGLSDLEQLKLMKNALVPIDIDTHKIPYNERLDLKEHYHFDFRYLFLVDKVSDIKIDIEELASYKWIDNCELRNDPNYGRVVTKINKILKKKKLNGGRNL